MDAQRRINLLIPLLCRSCQAGGVYFEWVNPDFVVTISEGPPESLGEHSGHTALLTLSGGRVLEVAQLNAAELRKKLMFIDSSDGSYSSNVVC